ncbi:hypothetical protein AN958_03274 [Leucoagaricus sp. SymC.cos]|nr:hypothetical protein AN958_03274 [Leucoagaricus sp. SymC.cos]
MNSFLHAQQPQFNNDMSAYYGPYTRLLYHLFGVDGPYEVIPRYHVPLIPRESLDVIALFTVEVDKRPVMFIELKPVASLTANSQRKYAEEQMRDHFLNIRNKAVIPHVPGISAFGTRIAFYDYNAATHAATPPAVPADPIRLNDTAPIERWNHDLLEPEGAARFREIVDQVKTMCQALMK